MPASHTRGGCFPCVCDPSVVLDRRPLDTVSVNMAHGQEEPVRTPYGGGAA